MEPDDLRRRWREALEQRLIASLRSDDRSYEVWTARCNRYERQARQQGIDLSEVQ